MRFVRLPTCISRKCNLGWNGRSPYQWVSWLWRPIPWINLGEDLSDSPIRTSLYLNLNYSSFPVLVLPMTTSFWGFCLGFPYEYVFDSSSRVGDADHKIRHGLCSALAASCCSPITHPSLYTCRGGGDWWVFPPISCLKVWRILWTVPRYAEDYLREKMRLQASPNQKPKENLSPEGSCEWGEAQEGSPGSPIGGRSAEGREENSLKVSCLSEELPSGIVERFFPYSKSNEDKQVIRGIPLSPFIQSPRP